MSDSLIKIAVIKKLPGGKYRVMSEKGKNLGTYDTKSEAKKRLQQVEFFKHVKASSEEDKLDLTDVEDFTYSAFLRKLRKKLEYDEFLEFIKTFKSEFDLAIENDVQEPEKISLQKTLVKFNKNVRKIKITKDLIKNAAVSELGNAEDVGKYLSGIVRFILNRIRPESRQKSIENLRNKFYELNPYEISIKKMPASSSLGQSITFVKHVLFNHDAAYVKKVLDSLAKNL